MELMILGYVDKNRNLSAPDSSISSNWMIPVKIWRDKLNQSKGALMKASWALEVIVLSILIGVTAGYDSKNYRFGKEPSQTLFAVLYNRTDDCWYLEYSILAVYPLKYLRKARWQSDLSSCICYHFGFFHLLLSLKPTLWFDWKAWESIQPHHKTCSVSVSEICLNLEAHQ